MQKRNLTKSQLLEKLTYYPDDMEIRLIGVGGNVVHISNQGDLLIFSDTLPLGYCKQCGYRVYQTPVQDYTGYCPVCDSDLYDIEIEPEFIYKDRKLECKKEEN